MRLRVIAVGTRMSAWVEAACEDYLRRLRGADAIEIVEVPVVRRHGVGDAKRAVKLEAERILALLAPREYVVTLDEHGRSFTTLQLSTWLAERRTQGEPVSFIIGGPDGLDAALSARAQLRWSLSALTFPHAVVRVLLAEQLYRASTVLAGHPYHRG
ncbi:MAG TPA: 23S rRNA (pseudouridine(1915)-N(3))-methyltransferase RlmH [Steroidobacteraceae bacterium]|jgi:23S rRNA (pseudouridine1915-N3)-methyltransferase|nr:23S rRNA (pseudouridine(1915)-N(3))-methyltransferase RlmH [Steroidobacteraceae bacterium]